MKICGASALSLNKKQSSTYNKYACGCFLYAPSIYTASLQKSFQNSHGWWWFQAESSSHCELAAQECTGGTFLSVPAVLFCLTSCICTIYFQKSFQYRHGWRRFYAAAMFLHEQKLVSKYCTRRYSICAGIFSLIVDWCSARTIILLSTRQEMSLMMLMYMTLSSRMFSTGHERGRFVPCRALYNAKKFSFAFSSSLNRSTNTESLYLRTRLGSNALFL